MKTFKRLIVSAVCAVIAVVSLSGCDSIFGHDGLFGQLSGSNSGGCRHENGGYVGSDETTHYKICVTCGEKYSIEKHTLNFGHDDKSHYNYCVWCEHRVDVQPHTYGEWKKDSNRSYRRCTHEYCRYEEKCTHENQHYTITDVKHYFTCDYCEYDFTGAAHVYNKYCSFTETTHSTGCVCGKPNGETQPHYLQYQSNDGAHWQHCICGYETAKSACDYGEYLYTEHAHYQICSKCGLQSAGEAHSLRLLYGERGCKTCEYVKHPYKGLLGTWRYTVGMTDYLLVLSSNWSYTIKQRVSGAVEKQGKYDMFIEENSNGTVTGRIDFMLDGELTDSSLSVKFEKGETAQFFGGGRKYVKI